MPKKPQKKTKTKKKRAFSAKVVSDLKYANQTLTWQYNSMAASYNAQVAENQRITNLLNERAVAKQQEDRRVDSLFATAVAKPATSYFDPLNRVSGRAF